MIWFLIGFIFGVFVAQESPTFPNVKKTTYQIQKFIYEVITEDRKVEKTERNVKRSKSE